MKAAALALVLVLSLCACTTTRHGVVQAVEVHYVAPPAQDPPTPGVLNFKPKVVGAYRPTGYVVVSTAEGSMKCRSSFASITVGDKATIRETSPGEWAVTSVD